jgi:lipopolysaccharide assembly outer membrane protein LptD (OstA)
VAPQAILDEDADTVTLLNSVHAQTSTGMQLDCDRLVYDRTGQVLRGNGNVVIIDPKGFRGTGSSFQSDISLTHMQMQ